MEPRTVLFNALRMLRRHQQDVFEALGHACIGKEPLRDLAPTTAASQAVHETTVVTLECSNPRCGAVRDVHESEGTACPECDTKRAFKLAPKGLIIRFEALI